MRRRKVFPHYRSEMKGLPWGVFYDENKHRKLDPAELEKEIEPLLMDDDVTKKSGVYEYVLTGDERALHIRAFTPGQKRGAYERQHGICPYCEREGNMKRWDIKEMEADHILHPGRKADIRRWIIARCFVKNTTKRKGQNKNLLCSESIILYELYHGFEIHEYELKRLEKEKTNGYKQIFLFSLHHTDGRRN